MGTSESEARCPIRFSSAEKLRNFSPSQLHDAALYARLCAAIDGLIEEARPTGCVKLANAPDLYRLRVGDYRIVYQVKDAALVVVVLSIGHRREIYRR